MTEDSLKQLVNPKRFVLKLIEDRRMFGQDFNEGEYVFVHDVLNWEFERCSSEEELKLKLAVKDLSLGQEFESGIENAVSFLVEQH